MRKRKGDSLAASTRQVGRFSVFSLFSILLAKGAALFGQVGSVEKPNGGGSPDVLFIVSDELTQWLGFAQEYPGTVHTPNIDRLANRGVAFTRAYCNAPACSPSRASFLSGMRPSTSGAYYGEKFREILPDAITLPQHFRENGYRTVGGGKIFHSFQREDERSWDEYLDYTRSPRPDPYPEAMVSNYRDHIWAPVATADEGMKGDYATASWAIEHLHRDSDNPLFLGVGFFKPHHPWVAPQKYFDLYPLADIRRPVVRLDDVADLPEYGKYFAYRRDPQLSHDRIVEHGQWEKAIRGYLATVSFMDAQVGRILDALDEIGRASNTVIVLFGDNGMHFGEKDHWTKWGLWEEATQVALIISAPGVVKPGGRCQYPVSLIDIYPTLVELCDLPSIEALEGRSLVPQLRDPSTQPPVPVVSTHGEGNHAVRSERWRYIRYRDGSEELYDHHSDPREWNNLAGDPAYEAVKKELEQWFPKVNRPDDSYDVPKLYWPGDPTLKDR